MANKFTQIIQASLLQPEMMSELDKFRREITVMFTDIRGSTAYFEKYGDIAGVMMVHQCTEVIKYQVEKHHGKFIKTIGDAVMATFEDCKDAVEAAIGSHLALRHRNANRPEQDRITIRIGLNYGPGIVKTNDVFGDVVNVASRVESVAQPEQIVISQTVNRKVSQLGLFKIEYLGKFSLKGKEGPSDLFEVLWDETRPPRAAVTAHTVVSGGSGLALPTFKLQHLVAGASDKEWELKGKELKIGQSTGEVTFQNDTRMAPLHARFTSDAGQVCVEDLSTHGIFVRLVATYTLQEHDIVLMGAQMMRFEETAEAVTAAAMTGTAIVKVSTILEEPVAQLVRVRPDGAEEGSRYALNQEVVTFGRSGCTYNFQDDFMSRTHARVYHRGENFFIEDCSRNGTYLKAQGKVPVPPGSTVIIGSQLFRVAQI